MPRFEFPGGARFAFSIIDDTDVATVANTRPVYRLLEELGMGATKTVWPFACPEGSPNFSSSETLDDPDYRDFVIDLQNRGFEIAFHGATMESSTRERTRAALDRFRETFGHDPRVHANHALNRENLYWGSGRIDQPLVRFLYGRRNGRGADYYQGHIEGSPYWWGDLCRERLTYVRNLTFDSLDLARINPSMPYHDPGRPLVPWWFSAADAEDRAAFDELLRPRAQARLEREGGFCIVATHFGKGFARRGEVHPGTRRRLEELADRDGWFPTVSELLDWLLKRRSGKTLPAGEWRRMQWRWAFELWRRVHRRSRRRKEVPG